MKLLLSAALLLATATASYLLWPSTDSDAQRSPIPITAARQDKELRRDEVPAAADRSEAETRQAVPMTLGDLLAQQESEVVFGLKVRKDRNCDIREHYIENGDGTVHREISCEPRSPRIGPFDNYSNEALSVLAETDWEAARELGRRLLISEPGAGTRYLLRAIALDTSSPQRPARLSPIWEIVNSRFKNDAIARGDAVAMKNMHLFYSLGRRLDPGYTFYTDQSRQLLVEAGFSDSDIAAIEERSALFLDNMNELRREVFGEPLPVEERL